MRVTREDTRSVGYCNAALRSYCAAYGIDWSEFVRHGLDESAFEHVKTDPYVRRLLAAAALRNG